MKTKKPLVVGLGEILWDILPGGKVLGGAPANFTYHCSQLGAESYLISAIGEDELGKEILLKMESLNQSTRYLHIVDQALTSTVSVRLDSNGHPSYTIHEGVAWDHLPVRDTAMELVSKADALCFGSLAQRSYTSRESIHTYLSAAPESCLRVFDVNLRQHYYSPEVIHDSLEVSDILKLNEDELIILKDIYSLRGREEEQVGYLMENYQLELVAMTRGADGSTLYTRSGKSDFKTDAVHTVDTVGAGDSFTAALVVLYLKGMELEEIHRRASALAAFVCTQKGATPAVPATLAQFEKVKEILHACGIKVVHFDQVIPNPTTETSAAGAKMTREHHAEVIVGLGGGSSMDAANAIAVEATHAGSAWDYLANKKEPTDSTLPVVAISTTSGTGITGYTGFSNYQHG